jgi:hypothetical protein
MIFKFNEPTIVVGLIIGGTGIIHSLYKMYNCKNEKIYNEFKINDFKNIMNKRDGIYILVQS